MTAILLVHGIWNSGRQFARLKLELERAGLEPVVSIDSTPSSGTAPLADLALQVGDAARSLCERTGAERVDVVGFSMGSLVARYWIQRQGGRGRVRRFVSIAGPQRGTWLAHLSPLAGIRDMRPRSPLLRELEAPDDVWREVELHCLWTPFDLLILPGKSGVLPGARSARRFPVLLHRRMVDDRRVMAAVIAILSRPGESSGL